MTKFYLHNGENQNGPFNIDELKALNINKNTPIWYEGLENWTTATNVEELKSILPISAVPPKFEIPNQISTSSAPPKFQKTESIDNSQNLQPTNNILINEKKNKLIRNILIGVGSIIGILIIGVIALRFYNNSHNNSNYSGESSVAFDSLGYPQNGNANYDNSAEIERQNINAAITQKNMTYRNNWYDYITTQIGEYSYREIGGIDPFVVQVTNNTEYTMDNIIVDVEYIKSNGEVFQTESLLFNNVSADSKSQLYSSGCQRGTSVRAQISNIVSSKMHFCYPLDNGNPNDPYFCKQ